MENQGNRTARSSSTQRVAAAAILVLVAMVGALLGMQLDNSSEKQIAHLAQRVETLAKFQEDTIAWRKQLVRNDDALEDWRRARNAEIAFQNNTTSSLKSIKLEMKQMSCAVCVASGKRCKKFCRPPEP